MQDPTLRGYSSRNIYNMVAFYEAYSSTQFIEYQKSLKLNEFVQLKTTQIENKVTVPISTNLIVQTASAQYRHKPYAQSLILNPCQKSSAGFLVL